MTTIINDYILPLLGLGIILFSIGSFFYSYGARFKDKTQIINAFGIHMEVSVLTLFIILGFVLSCIGVFMQIKNYESELTKANTDKRAAEQALEKAQKVQMTILVTLAGVNNNEFPKIQDVKCQYLLLGKEEPVDAPVSPAYASNQFRIVLKNITQDTMIKNLIFEDRANNLRWVIYNFEPFEPFLTLNKME